MPRIIRTFSLLALVASGLLAPSTGIRLRAQAAQPPSTDSCTPIDFETIPGAAPKEGLAISNQFAQSHGITFALANGASPKLAAVGRPETAFVGPPNDTVPDTPVPNQGIGTFFLTDDGRNTGRMAAALVVRYSPPTANASGVVLDLDNGESFVVDALDAKGTAISTLILTAGEPNTGDGIATRWTVSHATADIAAIRFLGKSASGRFGLGFDLFCARGRGAGTVLQLSFDASVLFDVDKSELRPSARSALLDAAGKIAARGNGRILVEGHTDSTGTADHNERLSLERAKSVENVLSGVEGLKTFKFESVGYGARRPIASNDTDAGRQRNRRVEIVLLGN